MARGPAAANVRAAGRARIVPVRQRFGPVGDLEFWACVLVAARCASSAIARPQARLSSFRKASADVVILQDASASMYVTDVRPDRWRRSVQFLRTFAETLSWKGDRVALALFAQLAAPQVRLTKDPNALFFFIDHLGDRSPFRLENTTTWDTNIEEGIRWGLRLVDKDEELFGKSGNPKAFLVISDGQAWSGTVATALQEARGAQDSGARRGIGTTIGGMIPEPRPDGTRPPPVIRSVLDRNSLVQLAVAGGGEYFEIGDEPDRVVAFRIIDRLHRQSDVSQQVDSFEDLYRRFLMAAAVMLGLGTLFLHKRTDLAWQAGGVIVALVLLCSPRWSPARPNGPRTATGPHRLRKRVSSAVNAANTCSLRLTLLTLRKSRLVRILLAVPRPSWHSTTRRHAHETTVVRGRRCGCVAHLGHSLVRAGGEHDRHADPRRGNDRRRGCWALTGAVGTATVAVDATNQEIAVTLNLFNFATGTTAGHIHVGPRGVAGPVVINFPLPTGRTGDLPLTFRLGAAAFVARPEIGINTMQDAIQAIVGGGAYVNIHTSANPAGEIRGQLTVVPQLRPVCVRRAPLARIT